MNHLCEDNKGIIHNCEGSELVPGDKDTYVVWTKCGKDVAANKSFKSNEVANCKSCLENKLLL